MKPLGFSILALATVVSVAAAAFAVGSREMPSGREGAGSEAVVLPELVTRGADVASLVIESADGNVILERNAGEGDEAWQVASLGGYPAPGAPIRRLLQDLAALRYVEPRTSRPIWHPRLGLAMPPEPGSETVQVGVMTGDGDVMATLVLGHRRPALFGQEGDGIYLRHGDDAQSWLARGSAAPAADPLAWIDKEILDIPTTRIRRVESRPADGRALIADRQTPGEPGLSIRDVPDGRQIRAPLGPMALAGSLVFLELENVRPRSEVKNGEALREVDLGTFDGLVIGVQMIESDGEAWVTFDASVDLEYLAGPGDRGTARRAREEADRLNSVLAGWAFQIPGHKEEALLTDLESLLVPEPG